MDRTVSYRRVGEQNDGRGKALTWPPVKWVDSLMALSWAGSMGWSCLRVDVAVGNSTCMHRRPSVRESSLYTITQKLGIDGMKLHD